MKLYSVKTKRKAQSIVDEFLTNNNLDPETEKPLLESTIEECVSNCECGETGAFFGFWEGGDYKITVGFCDSCGDDDAFTDDVIKYEWVL